MSDRDTKLEEDEHKDFHEDGGDDEVRDGLSCTMRQSSYWREHALSGVIKLKSSEIHH